MTKSEKIYIRQKNTFKSEICLSKRQTTIYPKREKTNNNSINNLLQKFIIVNLHVFLYLF